MVFNYALSAWILLFEPREERRLPAGSVRSDCRAEEIEEPLMREIRYLDKLIDELAKGKAMEKILPG